MLLKNLKFIFAAMVFFSVTVSFAQKQDEQIVIAGITVEGNKVADSETIISISGLRVGDNISFPADTKLQAALRALWQRKQFSDVEINIDKISSVGAYLVIKVKEYNRLNKVIVNDNSEIKEQKIIDAVKKVRGDIISKYDLYLAKQDVKKLYEEEGLAFARIQTELEPSDQENFSNLIIQVDEGVQFKVESIEFVGNTLVESGDLEDALEETRTKSWWQVWRSAKFDKKKYEEDLTKLSKYYKKSGFMDAEILRDTVEYDEENEAVHIKIYINEGTRAFIRNLSFKGNTVYPEEVLLRRLGFEKGEPYDFQRFTENLNGNEKQTDVSSLYLDNGYLAARFMPEETRIPPDSVDITVNVFENERFRIRRIEIVGNGKTRDKVIRRELYTRPGDFFDRSAIIRSIRALGVLNFFNPETLRPDVQPVPGDNTKVDILYKVEERSTDTFNASVGFAGSFGITGAVGFTFNNFDISEPFRGGAGQILNFNWEFGQWNRYQTFSVGFTEPWLFDEPTTIGFNLFDSRYNFNDLNQQRTGLAVNFGRRFKWPDDYFRGDWSVRYQWNDIGSTTYGSSYWYRQGKYSEVTVEQRLSRISINDMFFPSQGSKFSLSTSFAMGSIGVGATDYLKNELTFDLYNTLFKSNNIDRLVLYLGAKVGYVTGLKYDTTISPIELYRMGGNGLSGYGNITPLRGYEDQSIGSSTGARVLSRYIAELRFAISRDPMPIYIYGFAEAGNVWGSMATSDPFDLKRSAGIGVQMFLNPVGIIGFSYGYGFDIPGATGEKSGWKFLFHLGQQ